MSDNTAFYTFSETINSINSNYKMYCPQKRLTSLIFNTIVSIGGGINSITRVHNFFDNMRQSMKTCSIGFCNL